MAHFDLPLDELRAYRPDVAEPADFDEFWRRTVAEARAADGESSIERWDGPSKLVEVSDVTFPGFGGEPIKAWLSRPAGVDGPLPALVHLNGYGGGRGLPHEHLAWPNAGYVHLFVDTRGQGSVWGTGGGTHDPHGSGPSANGVMTQGIDSPETYYYRRFFTDGVRAVDFMRGLAEVDSERVGVIGGSQGGGAALAVGALAQADAVLADVPFLCHFRRAVSITDGFPFGELVTYLAVHRGAEEWVFDTLSYFDGVNFAKRIEAPTMVSVALMDQICPPSTIFAAINHLPRAPRIEVYPYNGHEGGEGYQWQRQAAWLAETFASTVYSP